MHAHRWFRGTVVALAVAASLVAPRDACAYNLHSVFYCSSPNDIASWAPDPSGGVRNIPTYRMCHSLPAGAANPQNYTLTDVTDAIAWAHWSWVRDGRSRISLYWYQSTCFPLPPPGYNWMDNIEEVSQFTFNTRASLFASSTAIAITWTDDINFPSCPPSKLAADTGVVSDAAWSGSSIDTLNEAVAPGNYIDQAYIHELGHSYGLGHNDAWLTVMNSTPAAQSTITGSGFRPQPFPDETQALRAQQARSDVGVFNLTGTAFVGNPGSAAPVAAVVAAGACSSSVNMTMPFLYLNHYSEPSDFQVRYLLLPNGATSATAAVWQGPVWWLTPKFPGATYPVSLPMSIPVSAMHSLGNYRVWIQVDPSNIITETDEGDNMVPLNMIVVKGAPAC